MNCQEHFLLTVNHGWVPCKKKNSPKLTNLPLSKHLKSVPSWLLLLPTRVFLKAELLMLKKKMTTNMVLNQGMKKITVKKVAMKRQKVKITAPRIMVMRPRLKNGHQRIKFLTLQSKTDSLLVVTSRFVKSTQKLRLVPSWRYLTSNLTDNGRMYQLIIINWECTITKMQVRNWTQLTMCFLKKRERQQRESRHRNGERVRKLDSQLATRSQSTSTIDSEEIKKKRLVIC